MSKAPEIYSGKDGTALEPHHIENLRLLSLGKGRSWAIRARGIKPTTLKNQMYEARRALDVDSDVEALVRAAELGLIDDFIGADT